MPTRPSDRRPDRRLDAGTRQPARTPTRPGGRGPSCRPPSGGRGRQNHAWRTCARRRSNGARGWAPSGRTRSDSGTEQRARQLPVFAARSSREMRITSYATADRDLEVLEWPEPIKLHSELDRPLRGRPVTFPTWRPGAHPARASRCSHAADTLSVQPTGAGPEHPLVDELAPPAWPDNIHRRGGRGVDGRHATPAEAVAATAARPVPGPTSTASRDRERTGVFTGSTPSTTTRGDPCRCSSPTTC